MSEFVRVAARGVAVVAAVLMAGCAVEAGSPVPEGVPPPAGDPVPAVDTDTAGRPADQLRGWAAERAAVLDIPVTALEAYAYAAYLTQENDPDCRLGWTTLAGIGRVESHHGTHRGSTVAPDGEVTPPIRGVALDGTDGNMRIVDSDGGLLDGDTQLDRAVGPMQFIPETWRLYGVDANNDGVASPDNIDDAALSAAGYLCDRGGDMSTPQGWMDALRAYNYSGRYARLVRDWATAYAENRTL